MDITQHEGFAGFPLVGLDVGATPARCTAFTADKVTFVYSIFDGIATELDGVPRRAVQSAPQSIRELVSALICDKVLEGAKSGDAITLGDCAEIAHSLFRCTHAGNSLAGRSDADLARTYAAAAAQDIDASALSYERIGLIAGPYAFTTADVTYTPAAVLAAEAQPNGSDEAVSATRATLEGYRMPDSIRKAALKLVALGYTNQTIAAGDPDALSELVAGSKPTLFFKKGDRYEHIDVRLSWITV